jgi:D-alanyl-D-alanine-carboxypeptidase/D-alanyl-D-alanine-endopeptidase
VCEREIYHLSHHGRRRHANSVRRPCRTALLPAGPEVTEKPTSRLRLKTLTLLACAIAAGSASAQQPTGTAAASATSRSWTILPSADIRAIITQRVDEKRSAGIVIGVLDPDGHTRVIAYGDPGPGQPPLDGNSVFEIGSISKVFTATLLAEMVQDGELRLEDPVQQFLPATVHLPTRDGKVITLANLSEQNSGLPRMPDNFHPADPANPYADYTVQQMYDFLSHYQLTRDPGTQFEYSNLGVGLLGHVLSLAARKPYEELERERVWVPLAMTHTAITFTPWMKAHLALGHDVAGNVVANWDIPTLAGAGAIRSTTNDMLKFLDANLHPEHGPLQRAMAFARQERAPAGSMVIGLNWLIMHAGTDTIVWHNGGTGGYRTFIGFEPSRKIGVVVMTNTTGAGADDIGMHLLDPALPLTPRPERHTAIDLSVEVLARYVGTYQLGPGFLLDVTPKDGALYLHPTNQPTLRLWPASETEFFLKEVDAQITFQRDAQGVVTGLVLHQNGQDMAAPKSR